MSVVDYRLPENRREALIRYCVWQYRSRDLDTPIFFLRYVFKRQELNIEQRFWISFLFGCTYQAPTTYAIFNEIPDYENIDSVMLKKFNDNSYHKLIYQTDNKWNKGHLDKQVNSYRGNVGEDQSRFFNNICDSEDPRANYDRLRKFIIDNFYKFGRYGCWFYLQTLKECCGLSIEATSMQYGKDTQSPTDGLCYVLNKEEWLSRYYTENGTKKNKRSIKYTPEMIKYFDQMTDGILEEIKSRFPDVGVDYFFLETALCSFKKLFRKRDGRYLGYYVDRLYQDMLKTSSGFPGVDWDIVADFIKEETPLDPQSPDNRKMKVFLETGQLPELTMYGDLL